MASSANALAKEMQKIASNAQIEVQKLANQATEKSFQYNSQEASTARKWQEEMSNTSHQREVADLKKAGLNPVLSANSGAQSYTTSSASAQANDPSASVGSLAGNLIQSRTNAYSADTSAAATRAAAASSAAATRYAASQAAAAQRYAAAMAYQTRKDEYAWKKDYMKSEYKAKTDYMKSEYAEKLKQPVSNWSGLIDKYAQRTGFADTLISSKVVKNAVAFAGKYAGNPVAAFKDLSGRFSNPYKSLTEQNQTKTNNALNKLGININNNTRKLFVSAVFNGDTKSWNKLIAYMPKKQRKITQYGAYTQFVNNSARSYGSSLR